MKKGYLHLFIVGLLLILIQTFFQYNEAFNSIVGQMVSSMTPFIYAVFIAILVSPLVKIFENKVKMKRSWAIGISLMIVFLVIIELILIIVPNIINSVTDLIDKFPTMLTSLSSNTEHLIDFLKEKDLLFFDPKEIENNLIKFTRTNLGNFKDVYKRQI